MLYRCSFSWKKGKFKGKYFFGKPKVQMKPARSGSAMSALTRGSDLLLSEVAVPGYIEFSGCNMHFTARDDDTNVILDMREIIKIKKKAGRMQDMRVVSMMLNSHGNYAEFGDSLIFTAYVPEKEGVEELYNQIIQAQNSGETAGNAQITDSSSNISSESKDSSTESKESGKDKFKRILETLIPKETNFINHFIPVINSNRYDKITEKCINKALEYSGSYDLTNSEIAELAFYIFISIQKMDEAASDDQKKQVKSEVFNIIKDARKNPSKYGIGVESESSQEIPDNLFDEDPNIFTPEQMEKIRSAVEEKLNEL